MVRLMFEEVRKNNLKSKIVFFSFIVFSLILFFIASLIIGIVTYNGAIFNNYFQITFILLNIIAITYLTFFFKKGDKMMLGITGAVLADRKTYPHLYHITESLAIAAGMKIAPKCYVINDSALNAFATGFKPEKSYIVVTTGLIDKLNRQELEGVIAHEMSHIQNQDIKLMLYVAGLIGVFTLIGNLCYYMVIGNPRRRNSRDSDKMTLVYLALWILFSIIGVFFATIFKFSLSRKREYLADANGALLTRYPPGLANALKKISEDPDPLVDKANKATAPLFISSPFRKKILGLNRIFSTHPPIEERIKRLEEM